ncbi:hypothetical protein BT69DRAFT_1288482 [Atractiella rhizophila]|nr:hypothetical protein BT69DRAFT_1288482 [Atractiella rhizophila]
MDEESLKGLLEQAREAERNADNSQGDAFVEIQKEAFVSLAPPLLATSISSDKHSEVSLLESTIKYEESHPVRLSKRKWKELQPRTAGPSHFNLPTPARTPWLEKELLAMKLHRVTDTKRHYRKSEQREEVGEFFALGHILPEQSRPSNAAVRVVKRKSFVDALLEDDQAQAFTRRKFTDLQKTRAHYPKKSRVKQKRSPK